MERLDHPFDRGYWQRYDGLPRPGKFSNLRGVTSITNPFEHAGWDQCDSELRFEFTPPNSDAQKPDE